MYSGLLLLNFIGMLKIVRIFLKSACAWPPVGFFVQQVNFSKEHWIYLKKNYRLPCGKHGCQTCSGAFEKRLKVLP